MDIVRNGGAIPYCHAKNYSTINPKFVLMF